MYSTSSEREFACEFRYKQLQFEEELDLLFDSTTRDYAWGPRADEPMPSERPTHIEVDHDTQSI